MKRRTEIMSILLMAATTVMLQANPSEEKICFENAIATPYETVASEPVRMQGLQRPEKVKVLGRGIYLLNGKRVKDKESYVSNGDTVQVLLQADRRENANIRTTIVVGEKSYDVFTVTTKRHTLPTDENIKLQCAQKSLR
ncbi:MAG: hypothetical protein L3J47_03185 [Sulfurovum sp.]|nr:hypothetical protein [Sulfurovum sp.]